MTNTNSQLVAMNRDRDEFKERHAVRVLRSLSRRAREEKKRAELMAALEDCKPKTTWLQQYSESIRGLICGSKCGYQIGNSRI